MMPVAPKDTNHGTPPGPKTLKVLNALSYILLGAFLYGLIMAG